MAHPYRIVDTSQRCAGPPRRLPIARRRQHLRTAVANASAVNGRTSSALPCRTTRLEISHWSPPPGTTTSGTPASSVLDTIPCPPPQTTTSAFDSSSSWRPSPTTAHGGTGASGPRSRDTTTRDPVGSTSPGVRVSRASSVSPRAPVVAVDGATTTTGPEPGGISSFDDVGSKCRGPTITASGGQSGRGISSAGSVAISLRRGPGSVVGRPISARAACRCRSPSRQDRADNARSTASRTLPRMPTPGASPLPIGGSPFDGRYSGWGFSSTHGSPSSSATNPPATVITSDTTSSGASSFSCGTLSTAIRAARRLIFAPASASSSASVASRPMSSTASTPAPFAVASHCVPVRSVGESPLARKRRHSAMAGGEPGIGSGNDRDVHWAYHATAPRHRLRT